MMKKAFGLKEEGNVFFKEKDYKKALSKYCKVQLYIKCLAPPEVKADPSDPALSMVTNMKNS